VAAVVDIGFVSRQKYQFKLCSRNLDAVAMLAFEIVFTSITPRHVHWNHARFGKAQAIIRHARAGATSIVGQKFCLQSLRTALCRKGPGGILQILR